MTKKAVTTAILLAGLLVPTAAANAATARMHVPLRPRPVNYQCGNTYDHDAYTDTTIEFTVCNVPVPARAIVTFGVTGGKYRRVIVTPSVWAPRTVHVPARFTEPEAADPNGTPYNLGIWTQVNGFVPFRDLPRLSVAITTVRTR
jgi:hypothetical protein